MKPAPYGFLVGRGTSGLRIAVRARAYPDLDDFWDGNWLETPVSARFGGFTARIPDALLRADEIARFRDGLVGLHERLVGRASLSSMEEWVELTAVGDGSGRLDVSGELRDRPGSPRRLAFTLDEYDQSDLPALIDDLDAVVAAFPVRGVR